jgi:hypothetical protein
MSQRPVVFTDSSVPPTGMSLRLRSTLHAAKNELAGQLQMLLDTAYELGFVITVEPLAMGNYRMVGNVRAAR